MPCRCYWKPRIYETEGALQLLKVSTDLSVDGSGSIIGTISQKPVVFDHLFWDNFVQAHTTSCILLECHHAKAALAFSQAMAGDGHTPTSGKPLGRIAFEIQHVQTHPPNLFLGGGHFRQLLFFFWKGRELPIFLWEKILEKIPNLTWHPYEVVMNTLYSSNIFAMKALNLLRLSSYHGILYALAKEGAWLKSPGSLVELTPKIFGWEIHRHFFRSKHVKNTVFFKHDTHTHIYTYNKYVYTFDGRHIFRNPLVDTVFNIPWSTEIIYEKLSWFTEVHSWRISCRLEITWLFVKATLMRKPKDDFEIPGMLINSCRHPCDQDLLWYLVACHVFI